MLPSATIGMESFKDVLSSKCPNCPSGGGILKVRHTKQI